MQNAGLLPHDEILEIQAALLKAGFSESRNALLAGLDVVFVAGLSKEGKPADQILTDLTALNAAGALNDRSMPLRVWLQNAVNLAGPRQEAKVFRRALQQLGGAEEAHEPAGSSRSQAEAHAPALVAGVPPTDSPRRRGGNLPGDVHEPPPEPSKRGPGAGDEDRRRRADDPVLEKAPSVPPLSGEPIPRYADMETRALGQGLAFAEVRKRQLRERGFSTAQVDAEIRKLKSQLREGGRLRAGDTLGDYLLLERIGSGGYAIVWKAHDRMNNRLVAIKVLHANIAGDYQKRARFQRGARTMKDLEHPAVVRVLKLCAEDNGFHYFVMELLTGGDLRAAVIAKLLPKEKIVPVILRVGEALALAHERGLVHRDVKPTNVLLDEVGEPRLTDFDLVLVRGGDTTGGTHTGVLGSIYFTPLDDADHPEKATASADSYALGMTTVFCLYGDDLPKAVLRDSEKFIQGLPCTAALKAVLVKAVNWDKGLRFQNAGELCAALRDATTPVVAVSARSPNTIEGSMRPATRPPRWEEMFLPLAGSRVPLPGVPTAPLIRLRVAAEAPAPPPPKRASTPPESRTPRPREAAENKGGALQSPSTVDGRTPREDETRAPPQRDDPRGPGGVGPWLLGALAIIGVFGGSVGAWDHLELRTAVEECERGSRGTAARCERACDGGHAASCTRLAAKYVNDHGLPIGEDERPVKLYQRACDAGHMPGCASLGFIYSEVQGKARNDKRAVELFRRACDGAEMTGCNNLGFMYANGQGVARDDNRAAGLYQRACDGGVMPGCLHLGGMYTDGQGGLARDDKRAVDLYQRACDGGVMMACQDLGGMYAKGRGMLAQDNKRAVDLYQRACDGGVTTGCASAVDLYQRACDGGEMKGCVGIAHLLGSGQGVPARDDSRAQELFQRACEGGEMNGCLSLGEMCAEGHCVLTGENKTVAELYQRACDGGLMQSCQRLALLYYYYDQGVVRDDKKAAALFQHVCDACVMSGCYWLGFLYQDGRGVPAKDGRRALELFQRACDGGDMAGCQRLAFEYEWGKERSRSDKKAAELYQRACDGGSVRSCTLIGLMYADGRGVGKEGKRAVELYQYACDSGDAPGCGSLGMAYARGMGVARSDKKAAELYQRACDGGNLAGCTNLGAVYASGQGVAGDDNRAAQLYQRACDGGDLTGCTNLGAAYASGHGVARDDKKAAELYQRACDGGETGGCRNLREMYAEGRAAER